MHFPSKDAFHQFALDNWKAAIENNEFQRAVAFDQLHYNELVKKFEDVVYWDRWQKDTLPIRQELTRRFEKLRPSEEIPEIKGNPTFIVHHNFSGLAHETQLARNIAWLKAHGEEVPFEIVYLFGDATDRSKACAIYEIPPDRVHYLQAENYQEAAESLTKLTASKKANGIIYPSIFYMAFWMSLFVPHPNQKFIQMKYYPLHAGRIRHWAGGYRCKDSYYRINGCEFEQLPILDLEITKTELTTSDHYRVETNIGSISRAEKICHPDYNRFILKVLDSHPKVNYLYTGRLDSVNLLPKPILQHPRSRALGWVDPVKAISQFSIYLEPFPWGGGEMTLLALSAGIPYLTLETPENSQFGIFGFLRCVADGKDSILQASFSKSPSELLERIKLLLENQNLRRELGQSWQHALRTYTPPTIIGWKNLFNQ